MQRVVQRLVERHLPFRKLAFVDIGHRRRLVADERDDEIAGERLGRRQEALRGILHRAERGQRDDAHVVASPHHRHQPGPDVLVAGRDRAVGRQHAVQEALEDGRASRATAASQVVQQVAQVQLHLAAMQAKAQLSHRQVDPQFLRAQLVQFARHVARELVERRRAQQPVQEFHRHLPPDLYRRLSTSLPNLRSRKRPAPPLRSRVVSAAVRPSPPRPAAPAGRNGVPWPWRWPVPAPGRRPPASRGGARA